MKHPPYLIPGDKVAIVSPSGAVNQKYIDGAVKTLKSWQLNPVVGNFARETAGRFAGTDEQRLLDLQQALDDPSIRAVLCSRGGYGLMRIVEKLNFNAFIHNPKWLIGFSDITILHAAAIRKEMQSIHAVMARGLTENDLQADPIALLREILSGEIPGSYILPPNVLNRFGESTGTLVGGNLSVLYGLRGTAFDIQPQGKILFIEDLSEKPYHIDRMLQNFKLGGILSQLSGLLVGRFTEIEEDASFGKTLEEMIFSAVEDYDFPVAFNFPVGHVNYNLPVIHGAKVKMTVSETGGKIKYKK
ncbi:MAG: LD-carboxypeptidase [Prevotellaceae bacterium]|jgi:muramoyltetrapeptide carboxypeptidase|nr:LD-carboxypeptidase [Prevotellaceae bacterium]